MQYVAYVSYETRDMNQFYEYVCMYKAKQIHSIPCNISITFISYGPLIKNLLPSFDVFAIADPSVFKIPVPKTVTVF